MGDPGILYQFYDLLHSNNHHLHSQPQIKLLATHICIPQILFSEISLPTCMSFHFPSHALSLFFNLHYSPPLPQSTSPLWGPLDSSPGLHLTVGPFDFTHMAL